MVLNRLIYLIGVSSIAVGLLFGCSNTANVGSDEIENYSAKQIYDRAEYEMARSKPIDAIAFFSDVERLYPYSEWAKRSVIMQAFANHKAKQYKEARDAAERYIEYYPADEDSAYAQYIIALSYYDQIEDIGRDQEVTAKALQAFKKLIKNYPDSEYVKPAELKFDLAFDHLAGKEMEVGRYYLKRQQFPAAINRFRIVVEDYQTSSYTAEALHRLVEAYLSMGLVDEAQSAGAILGHNYQASAWYKRTFSLLRNEDLSPAV
ncbi:MAG: outer membrane protein assembly factor BamD [Paracoccaceae bacterium]